MKVFFFLVSLFYINSAISQKVVRKGVKPISIKKKSAPAIYYNLNQTNGKWQEVLRTNVGSSIALNFNDTLLLDFKKDKVETREGISMNMKGSASIDPPNTLNVAGDVYTIRSLTGNTLILNDGEYIRRMKRTRQFNYETLGKDSIIAERFEKPINIDVKDLPGKWLVYRRQAAPGVINDENLIKSIQFNSLNVGDSSTGEVVIYNADVTLILPAKFIFNNGVMKIITDKKTWDFNTYKANGKEFVFGNERLLYFTKPL